MNRVCYIHPSSSKAASHWVIPAGIFGLIDLIQKEGFKVDGLNYPMELDLDEKFSVSDWLYNHPSDFYLVDIHWFVHVRGANFIIEEVKRINPGAIIIAGGLTASVFAEYLMESIQGIDYIVCGDSEEPLVDLLKTLRDRRETDRISNLYYRTAGTVAKSRSSFILDSFKGISYGNTEFLQNAVNIPEYSFPGRTERRGFWLVNGRGCLFNCPACDGSKGNSQKVYGRNSILKRDISDILSDVEKLEHLKLDNINFTHDICSFGAEYYKELLYSFAARFKAIGIYNEAWQLPSMEFIKSAAGEGFGNRMELAITVHSGNAGVRKNNGKLYTSESLINIIEACTRENIITQIYFSRFLRDETYETLKDTFNLIKTIKRITNDSKLVNVYYEILIPDPCSGITPYKTKRQVFDEYINWKSEVFNDFYERLQSGVKGKQYILDQKIINLLQE